MSSQLLPMRGSPGSPYTRKMLALLRYRRIPYRYLQEESTDLPKPKVGLIPIFYFTDAHGEYEAVVDSTPIIRRLEDEYPSRSAIPQDPVLAFINYLLEDYGDEWLTKAMFHYRWHYQADIDLAGSVLPHYADVTQSDAEIATKQRQFSERQISRLYVVGSSPTTAPVIESSYQRFLAALNNHLKETPFLLGARPTSSDFACFGQLTQLTQFDPTPAAIAGKEYPRVHAWVSKMEDQSGLEVSQDNYLDTNNLPQTLTQLLTEVGRTYVPVMLANADALNQGLNTVELEVDGKPWVQEPFPYQGKCIQWLRIEYSRLSDEDKHRVQQIFDGTGCEALIA